jgi:hypothetical protein
MMVVVSSNTYCKHDCCVVSISSFVAPRGSSNSKYFTLLAVATALSGFMGTVRWSHVVADTNPVDLECVLGCCGFICLILVAGFELDVTPNSFLGWKIMVTGWLLEKLGKK